MLISKYDLRANKRSELADVRKWLSSVVARFSFTGMKVVMFLTFKLMLSTV